MYETIKICGALMQQSFLSKNAPFRHLILCPDTNAQIGFSNHH
ncbi:protein of unknown function (plasmid) [Xenorhabdus nematophila AN6/1]|nr:protein of unknown function [Xenorhabdus nematophila AN6/1]